MASADKAAALAERDATPGVVVTPMDRLASVLEDLIGSADRLAALRAAAAGDAARTMGTTRGATWTMMQTMAC